MYDLQSINAAVSTLRCGLWWKNPTDLAFQNEDVYENNRGGFSLFINLYQFQNYLGQNLDLKL